MSKTRILFFIPLGLILVLLTLSVSSLKSFPTPFDDEGFYGAYGYGYVQTGKFKSSAITSKEPFTNGNGWNPRVHAGLFAFLGKWFGYQILSARLLSWIFILLSSGVWFFIFRELELPGAWGSLLIASNERIFYSSHVFRPEALVVLFNSFLIWWLIRRSRHEPNDTRVFQRGLLNGAFVLAHGNGLVSAILNTVDWIWYELRKLSKYAALRAMIYYSLGSILAIAAFYFIQIHSVGGWTIARKQLEVFRQYQISSSLFESAINDIRSRWGLELVEVGGSVVAKVFRFYFYFSVLGICLYSLFFGKGLARKFAWMAIGCFFGYMFIVPDKIDIHIAEMIPFFFAAGASWYVQIQQDKNAKLKRSAHLFAASIFAMGFGLCVHHALKYRGDTVVDRVVSAIEQYWDREKITPTTENQTLVAPMHFWFYFKDKTRLIGARYLDDFLPLKGQVVTIGGLGKHPFFKGCQSRYVDPEGYFSTFECP